MIIEWITWISIGAIGTTAAIVIAMLWAEIMTILEKGWLAMREALLGMPAEIAWLVRLAFTLTGIPKLYKRYRYAGRHVADKLVQFHWWEYISAEGLSESAMIRWPYPPRVYSVTWIGDKRVGQK